MRLFGLLWRRSRRHLLLFGLICLLCLGSEVAGGPGLRVRGGAGPGAGVWGAGPGCGGGVWQAGLVSMARLGPAFGSSGPEGVRERVGKRGWVRMARLVGVGVEWAGRVREGW